MRPLRGKTKKAKNMAIYHLSMKTISRSAGRSSTAAAAYRSASEIVDRRTGEVHDYRRKAGVEASVLVLPEGCAELSRSDLWNGVEQHHKRGDAVVARELEVALPAELSAQERERLAVDFTREVANHYRVAADVCIHLPGKEGDDRNHHAHIMLSACTISAAGFGKKAADLDPIHCQRQKIGNPAELWRARWAELTNERLRENGIDATIDHRSLEAQGIDRIPTSHVGPTVTAIERRDEKALVTERIEQEVAAQMVAANEAREIERQVSRLEGITPDLSGNLDREERPTTKGNQHEDRRKPGPLWTFGRYDASGVYELNAFQNQSIGQTETLHDLRDLSSIDVVPGRPRGKVLLSSDAADQLAHGKPHTVEALRRDSAGPGLKRYKSVQPVGRLPAPNEVRQKGIRWLWQVCQRHVQTLVTRMVAVVQAKRLAARVDGVVLDLSGNLEAAKADRDQVYFAAAREYAAGAVAEFKADLAEQARIERAKEQARAFVIELATPKPAERKKDRDGPSGPSMG